MIGWSIDDRRVDGHMCAREWLATAHKLLRTIYYMLRNREVYRDPHTDYEKLMVKRNAPRWVRMLKKHGLDPATGSAAPPRAA